MVHPMKPNLQKALAGIASIALIAVALSRLKRSPQAGTAAAPTKPTTADVAMTPSDTVEPAGSGGGPPVVPPTPIEPMGDVAGGD